MAMFQLNSHSIITPLQFTLIFLVFALLSFIGCGKHGPSKDSCQL